MRYLIRCDMEGITGVTSDEEVTPGAPLYERHRDLLMHDLCSVIAGLGKADPARSVVVYDEHCDGRNVRVETLPKFCRVIRGKPRYRADWVGGLDDSFDALLMVGFHAMAGTPGATLPHTYEPEIAQIRINGAVVGEIGVEAALAGEMSIPMVLYTGDSAGAAEAAALIDNVTTVAVKESLDERAAICLPTVTTERLLSDAGEKVAGGHEWPAPLSLGRPVKLEIDLVDSAYRDIFGALHPDALNGQVVVLERERLATAWADYWVMKEAAYAALKAAV